jgi:copper transport protein
VLAVRPQGDHSERWLHRFSALVATAVAVLASTGMTLSLAYVGAPDALITTSYGAMVLTKIVLFVALLAMGVLNHRVVHGGIRLCRGRHAPPCLG